MTVNNAGEVVDALAICPSPKSGCFASDPDALSAVLFMDDGVSRADFRSVADSALEAGMDGTPLEDTVYFPARITAPDGSRFRGGVAAIGYSNRPKNVLHGGDSGIDDIRQRIARCAHACGSTAVGCPLYTPSNEIDKSDPKQEYPDR